VDFVDYYAVLGVSKNATSEEIDRAYRQLARKYHPDVSKVKDAEEQFKRVNEAYEVLKDATKRQHYDRYGAAWKEAQRQGAPPPGTERFRVEPGGPGGPGGFEFEFGDAGDFSDFFQELFGFGGGGGMRTRGGRRGGTARRAAAGADQEAQLTLSLEEAARGGKREITLRDPQTGRARTLAVTIPAGVRPGQRIRLAGQGDPGRGGGPAGHLYLQVEIGPHPLFRLEGSDLHTVLTVTPATAVLGGHARLQTLDGAVKIKIPAGSSSGQRIRLAGKGFPNGHGRAGDLYVEIRIVVPTTPSAEQRTHYEELARLDRGVTPEQQAGTR
jgi:curved DNA-binding protein